MAAATQLKQSTATNEPKIILAAARRAIPVCFINPA
jgi:hypothetical protein